MAEKQDIITALRNLVYQAEESISPQDSRVILLVYKHHLMTAKKILSESS